MNSFKLKNTIFTKEKEKASSKGQKFIPNKDIFIISDMFLMLGKHKLSAQKIKNICKYDNSSSYNPFNKIEINCVSLDYTDSHSCWFREDIIFISEDIEQINDKIKTFEIFE